MGKQLKELCPSKLAQFLAVQGGVLMLLSQIAFCSDASLAYANVRRELQLFIHAIADTGITIAAFVGILASSYLSVRVMKKLPKQENRGRKGLRLRLRFSYF